MKLHPIVIAIDGYSSSGKSTMAKALAKRINFRYIDSGAMYRAVALYALEHGYIEETGKVSDDKLISALPHIEIDFERQPDGSQHTMLNGDDVEKEIRTLRVSKIVSTVAAIPAVRHRLTEMQRSYGRQKGIVMDGRDIGTTVFPDAELKIFVNASAETRAQRRYKEMQAQGQTATYEDILANVKERDYIDEHREESPLRKAKDAIMLDNSQMSIDQQNAWLDQQIAIATNDYRN